MHVEISPRQVALLPEVPTPVTITISNTGDVIAGYAIRFLGADPSWIQLDTDDISLFPEESRTFTALVTMPAGIPAGERRLAVQVHELTPPHSSVVEHIVFVVPDARAVSLRADPFSQSAGRSARFNLLLDNTGNTPVVGVLHGQDAEGKVRFRFQPASVSLAPGEHAVVDLQATARQPFLGSPVVRLLDLHVLDEAPPVRPAPTGRHPARRGAGSPRVPSDVMPLANVTFVQQALVSRGPLAMLGLLAAISVFALVITLALSKIVGQSAADRNLALEIAAAQDAGQNSGTAAMSGTVRLLTSGTPVPGVAVSVFAADDSEAPLSTTATNASGAWKVGNLAAGDYKVTFRGAGFVQIWYPRAVEPGDGVSVSLDAGVTRAGLDVDLGGVPASIAGKIVGPDVSAATLVLKTPLEDTTGLTGLDGQGATVRSVPVGSDGTFVLTDVPSPSVYDLVVEKQGFATSTQRIDVSAGEERTGVEITLSRGDGVISGLVSSASGPLAGATVTVHSGTTSVTTMSLTEGEAGSFTVRGLPTPATFTVEASLDGYASQTQTMTLAAGQRLTGVSLTLARSSGSLRGRIKELPFNQPAGGVLVTVTDGQQTIKTATQSQGRPGLWQVDGLAVPGTYTITFSRANLASQTMSVTLDASGQMSTQSQGAAVSGGTIAVTMESSTAIVEGVIKQHSPTGSTPVGEVTVQLSSGSETYTVTTASIPTDSVGNYRIEGVPPGTYALSVSRHGVSPTSTIIELKAGAVFRYDPVLAGAASISGKVVLAGGAPVGANWIVEAYRASGYPGTVYRTTTTDADGQFVFPDVDAPEAYVVQVRRTRASAPAGSTTAHVGRSKSVRISVTAGTDG